MSGPDLAVSGPVRGVSDFLGGNWAQRQRAKAPGRKSAAKTWHSPFLLRLWRASEW